MQDFGFQIYANCLATAALGLHAWRRRCSFDYLKEGMLMSLLVRLQLHMLH